MNCHYLSCPKCRSMVTHLKTSSKNQAMELDLQNRLSFVLKFRHLSYTITADPIITKDGEQLRYNGRYAVDILDPEGTEYNMVFKVSAETGEWVSYFKNELHPSIINSISDAISNLTM